MGEEPAVGGDQGVHEDRQVCLPGVTVACPPVGMLAGDPCRVGFPAVVYHRAEGHGLLVVGVDDTEADARRSTDDH